jgi:hypothetical protein
MVPLAAAGRPDAANADVDPNSTDAGDADAVIAVVITWVLAVRVPMDASWFASPEYVAVTVCEPIGPAAVVVQVATPAVTAAAAHSVTPVVLSTNATVPVATVPAATGATVAVNVSELLYVGAVGDTVRVVVVGIFGIVTDATDVTAVASVEAVTDEIDVAVALAVPVAVNGRFSAGSADPGAVVPV